MEETDEVLIQPDEIKSEFLCDDEIKMEETDEMLIQPDEIMNELSCNDFNGYPDEPLSTPIDANPLTDSGEVRRKRGRPRKISQKKEVIDLKNSFVPPKRKRGRPRKIPLEIKVAVKKKPPKPKRGPKKKEMDTPNAVSRPYRLAKQQAMLKSCIQIPPGH